MSTRRFEREEAPPRSKCISCLCVSWKFFTCVFSHVTLVALVVGYCLAGAYMFVQLEADNEKEVKTLMAGVRKNTTNMIWMQTQKTPLLHQDNWTHEAMEHLKHFETEIHNLMKNKGWDGYEPEANKTQWTFAGSLFYSIIVITTIGYGHIAPKTIPGKISTIFYAILGIPLMLLCLSNIGDIMASSFRFLYWRVCCYVCTREPKSKKKKRQLMRRETFRQQQQLALQDRPGRFPSRNPNQSSIRRSMKTSQRSADSGFDQRYDAGMSHAYSDMDCRNVGANGGNMMEQQLYYEEREKMRGNSFQRGNRGPQMPPSPRYGGPPDPRESRPRNGYRGDRHTIDRERFQKYPEPDVYDNDDEDIEDPPVTHVSRRDRMREREPPETPQQNRRLMRHSEDRQMGGSPRHQRSGNPASRVQSLDRRMMRRDPVIIDFDQEPPCKAPIYCNKYAMEDNEERRGERRQNFRSQSMPRQSRFGDRLIPPGRGGPGDNRSLYNESNQDLQASSKGRKRERPVPSPSPRIMSPMGFAVHRQARHVASVMDENSLYDDEFEDDRAFIKPVPIWLCVFLVIGYILGGAFLFTTWEGWNFLDAAYFCFITLTTIGFGDLVPTQGEKENPEESIALCSLYLLFGIALLAMSFNLVQEEVISKVKSLAKRLGIIKDYEIED